jgi:hypothetical protein
MVLRFMLRSQFNQHELISTTQIIQHELFSTTQIIQHELFSTNCINQVLTNPCLGE